MLFWDLSISLAFNSFNIPSHTWLLPRAGLSFCFVQLCTCACVCVCVCVCVCCFCVFVFCVGVLCVYCMIVQVLC